MKRIVKTMTLCAALLLLASACTKITYNPFGNISGTVIDVDSREPLGGATVTLSPSGLNAYTGNDGHFEFNEIDAQQYTITVQKTGYQANRKDIEALSGETINISLTMKKQQKGL